MPQEFITFIPKFPENRLGNHHNLSRIEQIIILKAFTKAQGVETGLDESKHLVEVNENAIHSINDLMRFIKAVTEHRIKENEGKI